MTRTDVDVVVVGAGLAGLAAARDLEASGVEALVLEARDRIGGRTLNHETATGEGIEIGGQWVGPTQDRILDMAARLEVETFPTYCDGRNVISYRGRLRRYRGQVPRLPIHVLMDLGQAQLRLDRMARGIPLEEPWSARHARRWDTMTVETWLRRAMRTRGGKALMHLAVTGVFSAEPGDISLLHFLFYSRSGGLSRGLMEAQQWRFVGGSQQVAIRQAQVLRNEVRLGAPVRSIRQEGSGVVVAGEGFSVHCLRVVVTVPPALAGRIRYDPVLSSDRDQLMQCAPMGSAIKILAIYDSTFWREQGLSGQATADVGPVRVVFDNSPVSGTPGVLVGFVEAQDARRFRRMSTGARRQAALTCLARFFGRRAVAPSSYVEMDWSAEEWSRGCYGAFFPPGVWTSYGHALRAPVGRIHWAGTETSLIWAGYMDGAVRSGERVAEEVRSVL